MSNSPYLPPQIKEYLKKFDIEQTINQTVNALIRQSPNDPYAYLISCFQKKAKTSIEISDLKAIQVLSGDNFPVICLKAKLLFLGRQMSLSLSQPLSILSDENVMFEGGLNGKGLTKQISFLLDKIFPRIKKYRLEEQQQIDKQIQKVLVQNGSQGVYAAINMSLSPVLFRSQVLGEPSYKIFGQLAQNKSINKPKCIVGVLQGGKAIGSKCKIYKLYIIANKAQPTIVSNVMAAIRKGIVSGKGGEAALKLATDGSWICPLDTINDNIKIIQDAIVSSNAKQHVGIGLSWLADSLYTVETKKYQLQNPKAPLDNDQMIDFLVKLVQQKPLIQYLQDPLASGQKASWRKLYSKLKQNEISKKVKLGIRLSKLINFQADLKIQLNQLFEQQNADTHPEADEQSRTTANLSKIKLDLINVKAYQFKTLSKLNSIHKQLSKHNIRLAFTDCQYETYDTTLVDLAVGLDGYVCLSNLNKFDRSSKLNRIRQILTQ